MKVSPAQAFVIGVAVGITLATLGQRWQAARQQPGTEAQWRSSE